MPYQFGGHGVDVKLVSRRQPADVFWSEQGNSYVLVTPREPSRAAFVHPEHGLVQLASVNGLGEIRWMVDATTMLIDKESQAAAAHFGLSPRED